MSDAAGSAIAQTPEPPYTAVIFTSVKTGDDLDGYAAMAAKMDALAAEQPGYLGIESAGNSPSITVSYWAEEFDAQNWKQVADHLGAQALGKKRWYADYMTRVATVHRAYGHPSPRTD